MIRRYAILSKKHGTQIFTTDYWCNANFHLWEFQNGEYPEAEIWDKKHLVEMESRQAFEDFTERLWISDKEKNEMRRNGASRTAARITGCAIGQK